jgi:hypothetical protein
MRVAEASRPQRRKSSTSAAAPEPPGRREARPGAPHGRGATGQGRSKGPEAAVYDLLRGLRAGDLETVLLTVAMAAEENRMPSADPDEAARILRFLTRLAGHDAGLPPCPDNAGLGPDRASDAD